MNKRGGFTLAEVLAAVGIFTLVLLGSFVAIGRILDAQNMTYNKTKAATFAMMLSKMYMSKANASGPDPVGTILTATTRPPGASDSYIGGTTADRTGGTWYLPTDASTEPNCQSYQDMLVYIGGSALESNLPGNESLRYAQVSIWSIGIREDFSTATLNSANRRIRFLGRYVMAVSR
jgi:type II secretory pathway pseudopilin PulG